MEALPDYFKCPISMEIMSDPVILSSGHTFDRSSIQRWLRSGNRTCPITKLPLSRNPSLIPNHAIRSLISNFFSSLAEPEDNRRHPEPQTLISVVSSPSSSVSLKLYSLSQLNRILKSDPTRSRRRLAELGAVSAVHRCVDSDDSALQERALSLLLNLSLDDDNKVGLVAEGAVGKMIAVLRGNSGDCRAVAATVMTSLAVLEVNKATIGSFPGAIKALVNLIRIGKELRERKEAATALYTICSYPDNRRLAVACGAVPILSQVAEAGLDRAVEVLGLLVKCKEGREEMIRYAGLVRILAGVLKNGSSRGVQHGLYTLSAVCLFSEQLRREAENEGVLDICLGFLDDENEKIRRNANGLVDVLKWKK